MPSKTSKAPQTNATILKASIALIDKSPLFDRDWYVATYPSVGLSKIDPAHHYLAVGAELDFDPGPNFNTRAYLALHKDVKKAGVNPLLHFERNGRSEGRQVALPDWSRNAPAQAIAASTSSPRTWHITRKEAQDIIASILTANGAGQPPKRLMPAFDAMTARCYAAAADVLYDEDCAALKATVIVPTYNRGAQLALAIQSVLEQSHRNLELFICDDGSTDDTRARLEPFADDPRLHVFWNDHAGVSAARNTGLNNATGDFVFYLDSDNTWTPDYLKMMLVGLTASGADCAYAASCIVTDSGMLVGYRGEPFDWQACITGNYVDMNVFAHRIGLVADLGGFDTDLRRVVDWDLILRYTKDHTVAFFPFIGCRYIDDMGDQSRITVSQPNLYRKIVIEKNDRGLRSGSATIDVMPLAFGIKIAAPYNAREEWGDFHYAESLAVSLEGLGHTARIDFRDDWHPPAGKNDDVVLVLRGLVGYKPRRGQLTLMWNISHPDQVPYSEYNGCNQVLVASRSYAALLSIILERQVHAVEQCTDTARFNLPPDAEFADSNARGLFVGNSRLEYRDMVRWSIENDIDIDVYGTRWDGLIPPERISGEHVPNSLLGAKYRAAQFVLNDHWQSMKDFGFVSNRVFDVLASGGRLISDKIPALDSMFGDVVDTVEDEAGLLAAEKRLPPSPERRRAAASHIAQYHSFDARAKTIQAAVKSALVPNAPSPMATPDFAPPVPRRTVGLLLQRGRAWWTSSAYIRLIGPLTSEHAHSVAGLDLITLDGSNDPRLDDCDICIVQRVAVADPDEARRLVAKLESRNVPLYVDTDDAFFLHKDYLAADKALRLLMAAARETWFSTQALADLYSDAAPVSRIRPNNLDPRFWRNYRKPVDTTFDSEILRFVYMGTNTHNDDLNMVMPAFERLAQNFPGRFNLSMMGVTASPPKHDWLKICHWPVANGSYPNFVRLAARENAFDVGIAPLVPTDFNAAKSDIKFLDYCAMGLLSVVSNGPVYQDCIAAKLAIGCDADTDSWYKTLSGIIARPANFNAMRQRAAKHLWTHRNSLADPAPLADLLI